jgi:hypothetical protein
MCPGGASPSCNHPTETFYSSTKRVISGFYILDVDKMPVTKEEKRKRRI